MTDHDVTAAHTFDDGVHLVCKCGKTFDGPDARSKHRSHSHIETARAALNGRAS